MSGSVLVVGSVNMDLVFRTQAIPRTGETVLGRDFATHPGGKGANQAVAIGRLAGATAFAGCVGDDVFGTRLRTGLESASVDVRHLRTVDGPSGTAGIIVDDEGHNIIVVAPGANHHITPEHARAAIDHFRPAVVLAQLEIPLETVLEAARAELFVLNPAPARPLPPELIARCHTLTPNESETESLTGILPTDDDSCDRAGAVLLTQGARYVLITLGARGSYLVSARGGRHFPAPEVRAIDTTAAGDAFNGALAIFLAEGREMENAVALANCVGALSTTRAGAQDSMPTRDELRAVAGDLY